MYFCGKWERRNETRRANSSKVRSTFSIYDSRSVLTLLLLLHSPTATVTDEEEGMATAASFAPAFEGVHGQVVVAASLDGELHVYHNEQPEES
jgi:hypothetical protein